MTNSIDKRMMKLAEKMRRLQQTMAELEAKKKPKLTIQHDEIRNIAAQIKELSAHTGEHVNTITDLITKAVGGKAGNRRGPIGSVAPKYRDPANPENTWSGRGIAPKWLQNHEAMGHSREDFLIR